MARYRKVDTRIWNDKKYNCLSDNAKFAFLFLLTHQHLTPIGAMRATVGGLAEELHWEISKFKSCLDEILNQGMARFDESASFLWLPNFIKYNRPESPNVVKSWEQLLDYLPECQLKIDLIESVAQRIATMTEAFIYALPQVFRKTIANQEQEQEHEHEHEQENEIALGDASAISNSSLSNKKSISKSETYKDATEILIFLNEIANKAFEPTIENLTPIVSRLLEGESVEVCRQVIANKYLEWHEVKKMKPSLNPETLFGVRFSRYKGELVLPKEEDSNHAR